METKELKIQIPEGFEIDKEKSTFEKIVFKPKSLTYKNVARELFKEKSCYTIGLQGSIIPVYVMDKCECPNNATLKAQLQCIFAKNKLANVARYLNGDWKDYMSLCYGLDLVGESIRVLEYHPNKMGGYVTPQFAFKSIELAKQAIKILGEEEIKLALKPLY